MHISTIILLVIANTASAKIQFKCNDTKNIDAGKIAEYIEIIDTQEMMSSPSTVSIHYQRLFERCVQNRQPIKSLNNKALDSLFRSMISIVFYTENKNHVDYMRSVFDEKLKRGDRNKDAIERMHSAYISVRQFEQARQLEYTFSDIGLPITPSIELLETHERTLLRLADNGKKLVQETFSFPKGGYVVVISSPMCGFSRRFMEWLRQQPSLFNIFAKHSIWITPVDGYFNIEEMLKSNRRNKPIHIKYTYSSTDWPEITYWGTPTLYFYNNGELKKQIIGWPKEGRGQEVLTGLKEISLLKQ
ncbi:hypothetical protein KCM76_02065 [Zooshikella marina]|uniref:hypothetical protein n=1 Tax=Zooshikella ganghwensis TaxID=202772 RepID=UPI001BAF2EE9|nr:hypothetical protein [Zooshikella ganghwensis]MBU2704746.1 hypothetical protein [Zooshikella ganghwensis]